MKQTKHKRISVVILLILATIFLVNYSAFAKRKVSAKVVVIYNQNTVGGHYNVKVMIKADTTFPLGNFKLKLVYDTTVLTFIRDSALHHYCCGVNYYYQSKGVKYYDTITVTDTFKGPTGTGTLLDTSYLDTVNVHQYNFIINALGGLGGGGVRVAITSAFFEDDNTTSADNGTFSAPGDFGEVLPITLINFSAKPAGKSKVQLNWATATEINTDYFQAERSIDAVNFIPIAIVNAKGNSISNQYYQYADLLDNSNNGNASTLYYRLKEMDENGTSSYSGLSAVNLSGLPASAIAIYPNPAGDWLSLNSDGLSGSEMEVTDLLGKAWLTQKATDDKVTINLTSLPAGVYLLKVKNNESATTQKFIKQ